MSSALAAGISDGTAGVAEAVRAAAARRMPLRIIGCGTWLDAGHPTSSNACALHLDALAGITEYTPGDLTLTARAGTTLGAIADAVAAEGQWLALDPFAAAHHGGSIGATIATASAGPLAHACGLPRDVVLGVEVVTADGRVIRGGGRVVKNVAGFDLTRLMTGAWGTLGVITEVTVRLRGRPAVDETFAVVRPPPPIARAARPGQPPPAPAGIDELAAALRGAPVSPLAAELLDARLVSRLVSRLATQLPTQLPTQLATQRPTPPAIGEAGTETPVLLVRLGGNPEQVAAGRAALSAVGDVAPVPDGADVWRALSRIESEMPGAAVIRWSQLPSRIGETWRHALRASAPYPDACIHASLGRGVVRTIIPRPEHRASSAHLAEAAQAFAGTCAAERLPLRLWGAMAPSPARDPLSRRVRQAFDPDHILNPGILGEGAEHA